MEVFKVEIPEIRGRIDLWYNGEPYIFIDTRDALTRTIYKSDFDFRYTHYYTKEEWIEEEKDCFRFWWEEGNGGCDCNRSIFIKRFCDPDFPDMTCGHEIELLGIKFLKEV